MFKTVQILYLGEGEVTEEMVLAWCNVILGMDSEEYHTPEDYMMAFHDYDIMEDKVQQDCFGHIFFEREEFRTKCGAWNDRIYEEACDDWWEEFENQLKKTLTHLYFAEKLPLRTESK